MQLVRRAGRIGRHVAETEPRIGQIRIRGRTVERSYIPFGKELVDGRRRVVIVKGCQVVPPRDTASSVEKPCAWLENCGPAKVATGVAPPTLAVNVSCVVGSSYK